MCYYMCMHVSVCEDVDQVTITMCMDMDSSWLVSNCTLCMDRVQAGQLVIVLCAWIGYKLVSNCTLCMDRVQAGQ